MADHSLADMKMPGQGIKGDRLLVVTADIEKNIMSQGGVGVLGELGQLGRTRKKLVSENYQSGSQKIAHIGAGCRLLFPLI